MHHSRAAACFAACGARGAYCGPMTKTEHLQFLALMLPTVVVLILAVVSLAEPDFSALAAPPAVDEAGHETAY